MGPPDGRHQEVRPLTDTLTDVATRQQFTGGRWADAASFRSSWAAD